MSKWMARPWFGSPLPRLRGPHVGPNCPPHPEASQIPSRPHVQEQDRLGMRSQLEGAGLGLPLQGGAWGHNPGSGPPRGEDAFCEEAGEKTHTQQCREGGKKTNSRRPKLAWSTAWAADSWGPTPRCRRLMAWRLRDPARLCP